MEEAGTGAGADNNPVIGRVTKVLSCFGIQPQHFWDGLSGWGGGETTVTI